MYNVDVEKTNWLRELGKFTIETKVFMIHFLSTIPKNDSKEQILLYFGVTIFCDTHIDDEVILFGIISI